MTELEIYDNEPMDSDKCISCPECGETKFIKIYGFGEDHRLCANNKCRQEWFTTIFYPMHINNTSY